MENKHQQLRWDLAASELLKAEDGYALKLNTSADGHNNIPKVVIFSAKSKPMW